MSNGYGSGKDTLQAALRYLYVVLGGNQDMGGNRCSSTACVDFQ